MKKFSRLAVLFFAATSFFIAGCDNGTSDANNTDGYSITIEKTEHGTISVSKSSGISAGEKITFTYQQEEGYILKDIVAMCGKTRIEVKPNILGDILMTMPEGNVVVTAIFEVLPSTNAPKAHKIIINKIATEEKDCTVTASDTAEYPGKTVTLTVKIDKQSSYELSTIQAVCGDKKLELTEKVVENVPRKDVVIEYTFEMPEDQVTVSAAFEIKYFTVTFDSKGGSAVEAQKIKKGGYIKNPGTPTIADPEPENGINYKNTFEGWYISNDGGTTLSKQFEFNLFAYEDLTLYAKWTKQRVYVLETNFDENKGTVTVTGDSSRKVLTITPKDNYEVGSFSIINKANNESIEYTRDRTGSYTFNANEKDVAVTVNFVDVQFAGPSKLGVDEIQVGDIVFSDGSFLHMDIPQMELGNLTDLQKQKAIAIIFYKGTGLNSNGETKERTLGVGLKYGDNLKWSAGTIDYKANIKTIEVTLGNNGYTGDLNGSDNFEQIKEYLSVKKNQPKDYNSENSVNKTSCYPAWYWVKDYKYETDNNYLMYSKYADNWYIPSIAELDILYSVLHGEIVSQVEKALTGSNKSMVEGTKIELDQAKNLILSSSQHPNDYYKNGSVESENFTGLAWCYRCKTVNNSKPAGECEIFKGAEARVIPIHEF